MFRKLLILLPLMTPVATLASTYTLEGDYTQVVVWWNHLGFSEPSAQLAQASGVLEYDSAAPRRSTVRVSIPLATLHTGVPALDEHLKSEDFFDTDRFGQAVFQSTRVEQGSDRDHLRVTGTLDLHGHTKPLTLDVHLLGLGINPRTQVATVGFEASTEIRRSDFGLGKFVPQVGDIVRLRITAQGAESKGYADYQRAQEARDAEEKSAKPPQR